MTDIQKAKHTLENSNFTCVLVRGDIILTSTKRGVSPMLEFLANKIGLNGFSVADKIVGKAAAFLFAKARIKHLFAQVLSQKAVSVLEKFNIEFSYEKLVSGITNRTNTGSCPMEQAVENVDDIEQAYEKILQKLAQLKP